MTPELILQALLLAADTYAKLREVAQSAGVTEEQLAEADARFLSIRPDPLGIVGEPV